MKKLSTKKRFNSKKGISMVLAIALSAVLFLSTTTFLSIAMLQQNETGTTMNSRQAYVSAKSALDMAEELLNDGKLDLPNSGSLYYVFYHLHNDPEIHIEKRNSASGALDFINDPTHSNYTIIGNAYIKITKNDDGTYTMTAVGAENKYTGKEDNTGDLSTKFTKLESADVKAEMTQERVSSISPSNGTNFLMFGDQAAFSLLRAITGNDQYRTLKNSYTTKDNQIIYIPRVESNSAPIITSFPLVFDKTVKIDSDNEDRCRYSAYNNAIYLLGNYSGSEVNDGNPYSNCNDLCLYTNNRDYGSTFDCKLLVVGGNMACSIPDENSSKISLNLKYLGDDEQPTYKNKKGIVVRFTRSCTFKTFTQNGKYLENKDVKYDEGYYFIEITNNSIGVDLFSPNTKKQYATKLSNDTDSVNLLNSIKDIDLYDTFKNKDAHSAYEENTIKGKAQVNILGSNGTFNTDDLKIYSGESNTINANNYNNGYDNYSIYCGPSSFPTKSGYYEMYSDEFNFQWYNTKSFDVGADTHMTIRANTIVLTIGPETGEEVFQIRDSNNSNNTILNNFIFPNGYVNKYNGFSKYSGETYTSTVSNVIKKTGSRATFELKPYWNQTGFTLSVMNDFVVEYDSKSYTIKKGDYTNIPSEGLNLFSDNAKEYFEKFVHSEEALISDIDWVNNNTINTSVANEKLDQSNSAVTFTASNGGTLKNGTYKAKAIYCDFGRVTGNNATLKANVISLEATEIKGDVLNINTSSGNSTCKEITTNNDGTVSEVEVTGSMLQITGTTKLVFNDNDNDNNNSEKILELEPGYYYFKDVNDSFNILDKSFWSSKIYYYKPTLDSDTTTKYNDPANTGIRFEGKYF